MNDTFISWGFINHSDVSSLRAEDDIFSGELFPASHEIWRHWSSSPTAMDYHSRHPGYVKYSFRIVFQSFMLQFPYVQLLSSFVTFLHVDGRKNNLKRLNFVPIFKIPRVIHQLRDKNIFHLMKQYTVYSV